MSETIITPSPPNIITMVIMVAITLLLMGTAAHLISRNRKDMR